MSTLPVSDCLIPEVRVPKAAESADVVAAPRRSWGWPILIGSFIVLGLSAALAAGIVPRLARQRELDAAALEVSTRLPRVTVATVRATAASEERVLPGTALPLLQAGLFPRTTGYIKTRLVDIGDRVEEGQLLALIDSPEIDDQLAQARADLAQARANLAKARADEAFASSDEERYRRIVSSRAVSQQDYEKSVQGSGVARAAVLATEAAIKVNEAAVQRYADLQAFEKITAPFAGVITARNIDPGDLVSANGTSVELFHVMRTDILRVLVNVPQVFASDVRVGQQAQIFRREDPRRTFTGKVARTADALDPATRTLLTEVQVPNEDGALRAGLFLQVKFTFQRRAPSVVIPAAALATRSAGPRVATLDAQHRIQYRAVRVGRDFGNEVEIVAGLDAGDTVVVRPGDDFPDGTAVEVARLPSGE